VLNRRVLGQGDLFVVVDDPFSITLDVCHIVTTASILANV
jgi:hypothetical protein